MSWQAATWATNARVGDYALKLLLLTLANYANEDGECWHSQKRISFDTEIPERTLRRKMAALAEMGLIEVTARATPNGGRTSSLIRLLTPPATVTAPPSPPGHCDRPPPATRMAAPPAIAVASPPANKVAGQDSSVNNLEYPIMLAELPLDKQPSHQKNKRCCLPQDFTLTDRRKNHAILHGLSGSYAAIVFDNFRNHHASKGSLMLDWEAAWRTWVGNEIKFSAARNTPTKASNGSGTYGDDWW